MTNETIKALKYKNNQIVITKPEQRISRETRDDNAKVLFVRENVRGRMKFRFAISISGSVSPSCETPSSCSGRDKLCISLPAPSAPSPRPYVSSTSPFSLSPALSLLPARWEKFSGGTMLPSAKWIKNCYETFINIYRIGRETSSKLTRRAGFELNWDDTW